MANRQSARQRMINLMYLVFIAMMALNISTDVLDGFDIVNENLRKAINNTVTRNNQLYGELNESYEKNPTKTEVWYNKSLEVKSKTDSLFNYIQELKVEIAQRTDGQDANVDDLKYRDNTDASSEIMVAPIGGGKKGYILKEAIDKYRTDIIERISDMDKQALVANALSTEPSKKSVAKNQDWVEGSFDRMPSIAVLSYLTGLQANVKNAEGEALNSLLKNIDFSDFRVNDIDAFVVPQSDYVVAGTPYRGTIALAAVDTTQRPKIVLNGKELPSSANGAFSIPTGGRPGTFTYNGYIEIQSRNEEVLRRPFKKEYSVMEPMATVAPLLMDVVYAGIDNPISISVPGVLPQNVDVRVSGGSMTRKGSDWVARPGAVGGSFVVNVIVKANGLTSTVAEKKFRIRELPDPVPFIEYTDDKGSLKKFKRGAIARNVLLNAPGVKAAIDDGILNIPFRVLSFRTVFVDVMGNSMLEVSDGANFSARQKAQIQKLGRGKYFFISGVKAVGPDGVQRELGAIEVRLN